MFVGAVANPSPTKCSRDHHCFGCNQCQEMNEAKVRKYVAETVESMNDPKSAEYWYRRHGRDNPNWRAVVEKALARMCDTEARADPPYYVERFKALKMHIENPGLTHWTDAHILHNELGLIVSNVPDHVRDQAEEDAHQAEEDA